MYRIITIAFLFVSYLSVAQELNCKVSINSDQVQSSDRRIFDDMENALSQFMNSRTWTEDTYESFERIKCNLIITLQNPTAIGSYQATVQIQSARPIYNSNYESIVLNFADRDWAFEYVDSQPLDFSDNIYNSNLTSLLAFYAYLIIGMDYDTFSPMGGTPYFQKALNVATNAQQSNRPGWDAMGSTRNRYWLIENLTNSQLSPVRQGYYDYHRQALDTFEQDKEQSRKKIVEVLKNIRKTRTAYPNSILVIAFLDAKSDELINIFKEGNIQTRREAFDALSNIDPSKSSSYEQIIK
ncbi:type IX secretion system protein PorD [Fulvivirga sediminis]|uniref:DUF4835 family protein n=1 Tax=Fulvivirga sediminis TaxID=2803949 RepID=A0A937F976_9BACT|nr:DUF4835 family protein [Fulvivirga sediminis]MBL3656338.1 DUF4835 family protein [Fulvivirga sediminis]